MRRHTNQAVIAGINILALLALFLSTAASAHAGTGKLVCIDPGHGGNTGAYNATYDLWEDEINLDVSYLLKDMLLANGYQVGMTRTDNTTNPSNNDRYTYCNSIAADILVSVHTNSSTNTNIDGTMTLRFKKIDKPLATALHQSIYSELMGVPWTFTDYGLDTYASGVLLKSKMPAAMLEPVIMSYPAEAELLLEPGGPRRQAIAQAIFDGIQNYFANQSGTGGSGGGNDKCPPNKPGCQ
jgi:N-acetylmuramoyl-L-alanine amidase